MKSPARRCLCCASPAVLDRWVIFPVVETVAVMGAEVPLSVPLPALGVCVDCLNGKCVVELARSERLVRVGCPVHGRHDERTYEAIAQEVREALT